MLGALGQFALGQLPFLAGQILTRPDFGGFAKKRKHKTTQVDEDIRRSKQLRSDLELAVYGPEIPYDIKPQVFEKLVLQPNVDGLSKVVARAQHRNYLSLVQQANDDDEEELAIILKDLS